MTTLSAFFVALGSFILGVAIHEKMKQRLERRKLEHVVLNPKSMPVGRKNRLDSHLYDRYEKKLEEMCSNRLWDKYEREMNEKLSRRLYNEEK